MAELPITVIILIAIPLCAPIDIYPNQSQRIRLTIVRYVPGKWNVEVKWLS